MSKFKFGELAPDSAERDAIHMAVIPIIAGTILNPGERVALDSSGEAVHAVGDCMVGVVDPFLDIPQVQKGQRFWLFLCPGSITSLRHHWTHPAVDRLDAEKWLSNFAYQNNRDYADIILAADSNVSDEFIGYDVDGYLEVPSEFWDYYEKLKGVVVPSENRSTYFTCRC